MHPEMQMINCAIMRGGTSKGIFIRVEDLPKDPAVRDRVILAIFGSPDIRQIDGLGGGDLLTSKLAIVSAPSRQDADVDYTFAQIGLDQATVNYKGNCGNIAAAIGPFAINTGLVEAVEPITTIRINMTNTGNILVAEVPVKEGKAAVEGVLAIDGVPGTGAKIVLDWKDASGAFTGKLLPTGNVVDDMVVNGEAYPVTIMDIGNPLVFVKASSVGIKGTETPDEIENNTNLMTLIEQIRGQVAEKIGLVKRAEDAIKESAYVPFVAIVSEKSGYRTYNGKTIDETEIDLVSRLVFMQKMHKTYPVTSTVSTGVAARIPGTVVYDVVDRTIDDRVIVNIGHPAGKIVAETVVGIDGQDINILKGSMYRTARPIMEGQVYVRKSVY